MSLLAPEFATRILSLQTLNMEKWSSPDQIRTENLPREEELIPRSKQIIISLIGLTTYNKIHCRLL
jgi:hypothetical protein